MPKSKEETSVKSDQHNLLVLISQIVVLMVAIGGIGQFWGGVLGAVPLTILPEYLRLVIWPSGLTVTHGDPRGYFTSAGARLGAWLVIGLVAVLLASLLSPVGEASAAVALATSSGDPNRSASVSASANETTG